MTYAGYFGLRHRPRRPTLRAVTCTITLEKNEVTEYAFLILSPYSPRDFLLMEKVRSTAEAEGELYKFDYFAITFH